MHFRNMRFARIRQPAALLTAAILLSACSKGPTVDGTYVLTKGPISWPPVTVTLANGKFVFSAGASGDYTVSDGKVLLTGMTFNDAMHIDGNKLVGAKAELMRTHTSPAAWTQDCSGIADEGDKAACFELKKGIDAEAADRRAFVERTKHAQAW
ncbi:hypothetical protein [Massilia sp. Root335]|uniref:hypothetical protein n=1 Tax=Massilia sp. Root335 TaxID=1736517 RepID=UPI0007143445|nr:hypothetical protein [Massilia sp. Root335]KQV35368.1 hypothetical protein ASC93_23870 [Massilia sp. Root335]